MAKTAEPQTAEPQTTWVSAGEALNPGQIAMHERHRDHPRSARQSAGDESGEVTVVKGGPPTMVAKTPFVHERIRDGLLIELSENDGKAQAEAHAALRAAQRAAAASPDDPALAEAAHEVAVTVADMDQIGAQVAAAQKALDEAAAEREANKADMAEMKKEIAALTKQLRAALKDKPPTDPGDDGGAG